MRFVSDDQFAVGDDVRLEHRFSRAALRSVLPQRLARFDGYGMQAGVVVDQNLPLAGQRDKLRRTVAHFAHGPAPNRLAIIRAECRKAAVGFAAGEDNHEVIGHQRRGCQSPLGDRHGRIVRPKQFAGCRVENQV